MSTARWAAGLLLLVMIGTGAGVVLLILVPIVWTRAVFGVDPTPEEEGMGWLE